MRQWHPIVVHLLRPTVEPHFEVRTNLPVGDVPREADIVLLRRRSAGPLPFQGLWRNLVTWNVLEYKGRSVSPRLRDLDRLVELGLGVDRRLNEERARLRQQLLAPSQVSFWYIANHLGKRFLRGTADHLGGLDSLGPGIWRWRVLHHPVFLVSSAELVVEMDTLPLHVVSEEAPETQREMARLAVEDSNLWELYAPWLAHLHPESWKEVQHMAKTKKKRFQPNWDPLLEAMKEDKKLEKQVMDMFFPGGMEEFVKKLSPAARKRLKRLLQD